MSALEEMNRLLKNSKFIPKEQKENYKKATQSSNPVMDFFNNTIFKGNTNEKKSSTR